MPRGLEILKINHKDSPTIISQLKSLLCRFGIPLEIAANNLSSGSTTFLNLIRKGTS